MLRGFQQYNCGTGQWHSALNFLCTTWCPCSMPNSASCFC